MSEIPVTQNDVTQVLSKLLMDVSTGKRVDKTKIEKQIEISDALCRRMQSRINLCKLYIEAKKHGVDFTAAMREIRQIDIDTGGDISSINAEE